MVVVEKRSKAKKRQKSVAEEFDRWIKLHPKAGRTRRTKMFDAISDSAYLNELVGKDG